MPTPHLPPYYEAVYRKARENLSGMIERGLFASGISGRQMYVYRVTHGSAVYTGLCCCLSVSDYQDNRIRRQ